MKITRIGLEKYINILHRVRTDLMSYVTSFKWSVRREGPHPFANTTVKFAEGHKKVPTFIYEKRAFAYHMTLQDRFSQSELQQKPVSSYGRNSNATLSADNHAPNLYPNPGDPISWDTLEILTVQYADNMLY